jgi:hypothetical protein
MNIKKRFKLKSDGWNDNRKLIVLLKRALTRCLIDSAKRATEDLASGRYDV